MDMINCFIDTGSEILAGRSQHPQDSRWQGFSHNWNFLLSVKGEARLQFRGNYCALPRHSLILISPDGIRNFTTEEEWDSLWIHFERNLYFNDVIEWEEKIPGVWVLPLKNADFRIMHHLFIQMVQIAARRERFWRRLIYCLIQEAVLRGNMIFGRAGSSFDTALAHKMLSNLQENLSMDEIAERCGLSRSAFFAKFTSTFDVSPRKYRENHLMITIQTLLETTDMSINDICQHVHMSNPFYLSARFKACFGISPREYRKRFRVTVTSGE
ncbi:MAG: helix-turn-helix transcriptional regulator [Lentisphaeria bacterium]|nr:helix-turn-helix transcriptional regulator [Lentisphaerota bacterium]MBQ9787217.1 helix-turn-helix transcriptional regulator [Lentisphaeria bacterium]